MSLRSACASARMGSWSTPASRHLTPVHGPASYANAQTAVVLRRRTCHTDLMPTRPDPAQNHLLAALPAAEWARWRPALEPVDMPLGQVLYESGVAMTHVYFPTTSIVSLLYVMEDGASAEIAVVGNEGIVGVALFMGGETTPSRSVVQSAGQGFRMRAQLL